MSEQTPRRRFTTDNRRHLVAVLARCRDALFLRPGDVDGFVPDPLNSSRVRFTLAYDDNDLVEAAIAEYPNYDVNVADLECADQVVKSIEIAAKRRAVTSPSAGIAARRQAQLDGERKEMLVRLDAVTRAQRRPDPSLPLEQRMSAYRKPVEPNPYLGGDNGAESDA